MHKTYKYKKYMFNKSNIDKEYKNIDKIENCKRVTPKIKKKMLHWILKFWI